MTKRVCNKKGRPGKLPFSKRPARSTRTWLRHLRKRRWQAILDSKGVLE